MLVLIDESGDPGFKIAKGSSPFFVLALVAFESFDVAENTSAAIAKCRSTLGISGEFHFNKCQSRIRDEFFVAVAPFAFKVCALVVNKEKIYSEHLRSEAPDFYRYFVKQLLTHDSGVLKDAIVKLDGSGGRQFKRELYRYLKMHLSELKVKKVKLADSKKDNLIQLADMVVGAIARSYRTDRTDAQRWRRMIAGKTIDVWNFG